ncbi:MAG: FecR family protein [Polyangia bacterium]
MSTDRQVAALIERAMRHEEPIADGASQRVWRTLRVAEARPQRQLWPVFLAGAALTGLLLFLVPRLSHEPYRAGTMLPQAAAIELHGIAELVTGPGAKVRVERNDAQQVELRVDAGSLLLHVLPRAGRAPFLVRTPQFVARVVGTVFRVSVNGNDARITVAHGTVEVTPNGGTATPIHAHEAWPANANTVPAADELSMLATREQVAIDDFAARPPHVCTGAAEARVRCDVLYAQEAAPREAENALYRAGAVAWHELDDPRRALVLWRQQRERFPNGALRREAQASMIDALVATRSYHDAEAAIESYLAVEPDDLRAPELHFVLATVLRQLDGSCRRAAAELELALSHPAGAWVAQAEEARRACEPSR